MIIVVDQDYDQSYNDTLMIVIVNHESCMMMDYSYDVIQRICYGNFHVHRYVMI